MSKTGCSVPVLINRGELVHHFGIFHCLVDDLFQEYAINWMKIHYSNHYSRSQCPYEDYFYSDEKDLLTHLTTSHYFNGILSEVEDMVKFSLSYFEQYKCMANMYKCPFCKKKFRNLDHGTESNVRDVKEMVIHCGVEHGFSLYYLIADNNVEKMREILKQFIVKQEPPDDEENNEIDARKSVSTDEMTPDLSNFLQVEMQE